MKARLLEWLLCPVTGETLGLEVTQEDRGEIIEGRLFSSTHYYPIIAGVPRMIAGLSEDYRQTVNHFRTQWENFATEERVFGRDVDGSWNYFRDTLCHPEVSFRDLANGGLVLDAGCGHGKYVDALSGRGIEVIGMDITPEVERVYRRLGSRPNVHIVQGNLLHPPFKREAFFYVFSNGVIHHTPDTRGAFKAIGKLVRPGGYLGLWVYPFRSGAFDAVSQAIRWVTTKLPRPVLRPLCYLPVPLLSIPGWGAYSGTSLKNSTWTQCAQVIYDFFGPKHQTHHTADELADWFRQEGFGEPWYGPDPLSAAAIKR